MALLDFMYLVHHMIMYCSSMCIPMDLCTSPNAKSYKFELGF